MPTTDLYFEDLHPGIITGLDQHQRDSPRAVCQTWATTGALVKEPAPVLDVGNKGLDPSGVSWPLKIPRAIWIGSAGNPLALRAS